MENEVQTFYGNRTRVRVCGLCQAEDKILLINHLGITKTNFWSPPGGGLKFGETAQACLKRELLEETGMTVEVDEFLFVCELIKEPLHAVELFFRITTQYLNPKLGKDPEPGSPQILTDVAFKSWDEIQKIPPNEIHGIFQLADHPSQVQHLRGYFKL